MRWSWCLPGGEAAFLAPLPVRRLWGVGPQARQALADYGVSTIGQLAAMSEATLRRRFGQHGADLAMRARGIDAAPVVPFQAPKSIGHEHTFERDTIETTKLEATLLDVAESVASRLRHHDLSAGAVQLKLRYEGFETLTRQAPLPRQTRESEPLYEAGVALLRRTLVAGRGVRLIGLTAINLSDRQQLTLFDHADRGERLARSLDAVRERFGESAITRARLLTEKPQPSLRLRREARATSHLTNRTPVRYHVSSIDRTPVLCRPGVQWEKSNGIDQDHPGRGTRQLGSPASPSRPRSLGRVPAGRRGTGRHSRRALGISGRARTTRHLPASDR